MSFAKNLILVFSLDGIKFAVDVENLVEVSSDVEASYSDAIDGYLGTILFRDNEIKLLNVQRRLGLNQDKHKRNDFIVVNAGKELIAIPVDSVEGVIRIEGRTFSFPEIKFASGSNFTFKL